MRAWAAGAVMAALILAAGVATACGGDDDGGPGRYYPPAATSPTPTPQPTALAPVEPPREFKVAFINLLSPLTNDANTTEAGETFDERLDAIVREMKSFDPDVIGFNEASVTKEHGSVISRLVKELKMDWQYARANPWFPGQTKEQSDQLAKQVGFEEGELILVRGDRYPILKADTYTLNPRTTEAGERRVALHVVLKGPEAMGEIDLFITHLTGGGDRTRRAQAADFAVYVANARGEGPTIVMVGQSDPGGASTYDFYSAIGLHDVAGKEPILTCCRESVVGVESPLKSRSDYLMWARWKPASFQLLGSAAFTRADGQPLFMSDHNGLGAVFAIPQPEPSP